MAVLLECRCGLCPPMYVLNISLIHRDILDKSPLRVGVSLSLRILANRVPPWYYDSCTDGQAHTVKPNLQVGFLDNRFGTNIASWCFPLLLNSSMRINLQLLGSRTSIRCVSGDDGDLVMIRACNDVNRSHRGWRMPVLQSAK